MDYTTHLNTIIRYAREEAERLGTAQVMPDHLVLAILRVDDSKASQLLLQSGVDFADLKHDLDNHLFVSPSQAGQNIPFSRTTQRILRICSIEAGEYDAKQIGSEHLLLSILRERINYPATLLKDSYNVTYESIEKLMPKPQKTPQDSGDIYDTEDDFFSQLMGGGVTPKKKKEKEGDTPALNKYSRDLTKEAAEGLLDPVVGREKEIARLVQILSRRKKNNPVLIGEPGVGKSAIVEQLALMIASDRIPSMQGKRILALQLASIVAGTTYRGQFEQRMQNILSELRGHKEILLFIDEIHTIIGAGNAQGSLDAANILKPALARGEVQCIGATTVDEYRRSIEKDGALERRFQKLMVEAPSSDETLAILRRLSEPYGAFHSVKYTDDALRACVQLSMRYLTDRSLPDKAIDAMDEAGARKHALAVKDALVTEEDIAEVVSLMAGVPATRVAANEFLQLRSLYDTLCKHVKGQDKAVKTVVQAIQRSRLGLRDPKRPIGTFFFLGPTGVGKTYLAQCLAEQLFGSKDAMIRLDMSEYTEKHTASLLVGAPPGYVAYDQGGKLTEAVRRHPYSVVLLDEIEKAHPDIFNVLLQVLDEGRLTDRQGRETSFRNTIIILTSNIGTRQLQEFGAGVGFSAGELTEATAQSTLLKALRKTFPPEFVNRMDDIISFRPLSRETLADILDIEIDKLASRMKEQNHRLVVSPEAKAQLLEKAYDPQYGARPIRRAVQTYLEDEITRRLLDNPDKRTLTISKLNVESAPSK